MSIINVTHGGIMFSSCYKFFTNWYHLDLEIFITTGQEVGVRMKKYRAALPQLFFSLS